MFKFKAGDKVKIDFKMFLARENEVCFYDNYDNEHDESIEYEKSICEEDQGLIELLFNTTTFTISMVDQILRGYNKNRKMVTVISLKELEDFDVDNLFSEDELHKVV